MPDTSPRARDAAVLDPLWQQRAQFLAFLERRVGSRALAEDILQEAYVRGVQHQESLRDATSASAWFYRLLRNAVTDHYRRRGAERRAFDAVASDPQAEGGLPGAATPAAEPDSALMEAVCACVTQLLDTLKPEYADALRHVELEETGVGDYAESRGITPNLASVRLHRARKALRRQLLACCGGCATDGCGDCDCEAGVAKAPSATAPPQPSP